MTDSATLGTTQSEEDLGDLLREVLPSDGSTMGNLSAREALGRVAERQISEEKYEAIRVKALALRPVVKGRRRGGWIDLAEGIEAHMITVHNGKEERRRQHVGIHEILRHKQVFK